ncbi:MAG: hypothetical protein GVY29_05145 [Spirochaetes bacterium]|jgi:hypothetical protein|nr:hypothetical protein [Spirochaetota bacterium]
MNTNPQHAAILEDLTTDQPTFPEEGSLVSITGSPERIQRLNEREIHADLVGEIGFVTSRNPMNGTGTVELPTGEEIFVWLGDIQEAHGEA